MGLNNGLIATALCASHWKDQI